MFHSVVDHIVVYIDIHVSAQVRQHKRTRLYTHMLNIRLVHGHVLQRPVAGHQRALFDPSERVHILHISVCNFSGGLYSCSNELS